MWCDQTGRDVFNEKPTADELLVAQEEDAAANVLPQAVVLHTNRGDISLKLFPDECPKTVENFTTHAKNGYFDGVVFHRVIKGFMIQTGDPLGKKSTVFKSRLEKIHCLKPGVFLSCSFWLTFSASKDAYYGRVSWSNI